MVLLYGKNGDLLYQGGVTGSRGHQGENFGAEQLARAISTGEHVPGGFRIWMFPDGRGISGEALMNRLRGRRHIGLSEDRAADYFESSARMQQAGVDRMMCRVLVGEWLMLIAIALFVSPLSWDGPAATLHPHVWAALLAGPAFVLPAVALARIYPASATARQAIAAAQALVSVVLIDVTGAGSSPIFVSSFPWASENGSFGKPAAPAPGGGRTGGRIWGFPSTCPALSWNRKASHEM